MRCAAFTVDVDRDVNEPRAGAVEAAYKGGSAPRYSSTHEGLDLLLAMLEDLDVQATFFMEGETAEVLAQDVDLKDLLRGHEVAAHGYAHEDLTGESTGIVPSQQWLDAIIGRSLATLEDLMGSRPVGFRAPYQHINDLVAEVLRRRDFLYDSTLFAEASSGLRPYRLPSGLIEMPLAQGRDRRGRRMQSYLWPLHEGRRTEEDYLDLLSRHEEGLFILADHSWHVVESLTGHRTEERAREEIAKVERVLRGALDQGMEFITLEDYLAQKVCL